LTHQLSRFAGQMELVAFKHWLPGSNQGMVQHELRQDTARGFPSRAAHSSIRRVSPADSISIAFVHLAAIHSLHFS
jgi:hypothetical protein